MTELTPRPVNNAIYDELGDRWYAADDNPVALLRAEGRLKNPWVARRIRESLGERPCRVLDVGCGAGFLANALSQAGHEVTGLDASEESLNVARHHDVRGNVRYVLGDALRLPFADASFDVVCAMDFLEHVEDPGRAIAEAGRVLAPGGLFFFQTLNRNLVAWLIAIKGVEWFVKNTPRDLHVLRLFIRPRELSEMCERSGLHAHELRGVRPVFLSWAFLRLVFRGIVTPDFRFVFTRSTRIAYMGVATRRGRRQALA